MNKHGFTLMELLVYMAIVGIVVVIAGQVYSDSTKMQVRTRSMISASKVAENVGTLLKEDVSQMGAKSSKETRSITSDSFFVASEVFIDPTNGDSSSYVLALVDGKERLSFRKIRLDERGFYAAVEEVAWYLRGNSLVRSCKTLLKKSAVDASCPEGEPQEVTMAENVLKFHVIPAVPSALSANANVIYPSGSNKNLFRLISRYDGTKYFRTTAVPDVGGSSVMISGFVSNYDFDNEEITNGKKLNEFFAAENGGSSGSFSDLCTRMTFDKGFTYQIVFGISKTSVYDKSQMFIPGKDHLAVGFRTTEGAATVIKDFLFYPPMATEMDLVQRRINFSVSQKVENVCLVFDVAAYSPMLSSGALNITGLQVLKIPEGHYEFDESRTGLITIADKKNVKAFRVELAVKNNGEEGRVSVDVAVPSNGAE